MMAPFSYLSPNNAQYIDELFEKYVADPTSVDDTWRYFFDGLELGAQSTGSTAQSVIQGGLTNGNGHAVTENGHTQKQPQLVAVNNLGERIDLSSEAKVAELINAYRERGRLLANLDPLGSPPTSHPLLELQNFKLTEADLERTFTAGKLIGIGPAKLKDIIARLKEIYCSCVAVEYTHIQDPVSREWVQNKMESSANREQLSAEEKKFILRRLTESETFENFCHTRYIAQKRFSIEGGEALIPALDRIIDVAAELGANNLVMGMAHRGRLNVLVNVFGKKPELVFTEFEDNYTADTHGSEGDVKYHKGFSSDIVTPKGKPVHLSLAYNPSHLEFVNPVVEGMARAKQQVLGDKDRSQVVPILIHGDAAFAGQGVVYETLNLSQLRGYWTGGTVHIIIDNQVGFTADPVDTRSTTYSTDLAKMLEVPIFHVNGDDPESVYYVAKLATEFRQKFKKDVFIDLICYRRYGHNEGDEPAFTQPLLYSKIKNHPTPRAVYAQKLMGQGVVADTEAKAFIDQVIEHLTAAQQKTRAEKPQPFFSAYEARWKGFKPATEQELFATSQTAISPEMVKTLSQKLFEFPKNFKTHPKLARIFEGRKKAIETGEGIDWGNGETLAYASLLLEGHIVRLSGQDVERGTFTHRHSVLHDPDTGETYCPLNHLAEGQAEFLVHNSHLSEQGVLGFEYGWSLSDPHSLAVWEAQFGDFGNGAQVIIDQFISSSESKWHRASGIVLLLPHGYEGQGPEHSSARLERFLQLCGKHNMFVCNFTTPAQIFHALRRQIKRGFRKPMIVMSPKSLLRHPKAVSRIEDFTKGSFQEVLDDVTVNNPDQITRLILCSGKIYYELLAERENKKLTNTAILRLEQLYPFPAQKLSQILLRYQNVPQITWVQEEPRNMGTWGFLRTRFGERLLDQYPYRGVCRPEAASPATGSATSHKIEQQNILKQAFELV